MYETYNAAARWGFLCRQPGHPRRATGLPVLAQEQKKDAPRPRPSPPPAATTAPVAAAAAAAAPADPGPPVAGDSTGSSYTGGSTTAALTKDGDKVTPETLARDVKNAWLAMNIMWTLITGFLVMFMQAGFALVETGLTRAKNVGPHDGDELRRLRRRHARVLDLRVRLHGRRLGAGRRVRRAEHPRQDVRRSRSAARRSSSSATRASSSPAAANDATVPDALPVPDGVHGHRRDDPDRGHGRALEVLGVHGLRLLPVDADLPGLRLLGLGRRLARRPRRRTSGWATATSTSPGRASCT